MTPQMRESGPVLVVDDDETIRDLVRMALAGEGYEVLTARNGQEALDQIRDLEPALILLDMRMPVLDGWEFASKYRSTARESAPIVVLTAASDAAHSAADIQADGHLAKPFDLYELFDLVARYTPK